MDRKRLQSYETLAFVVCSSVPTGHSKDVKADRLSCSGRAHRAGTEALTRLRRGLLIV